MRKRLVVFDLDGTLNKTETFVIPALKQGLSEIGFEIPQEKLYQSIGARDEDSSRVFFGSRAKELGDVFWERVEAYSKYKYGDRYTTYDGVEELLGQLKSDGYLLAICSNANLDYIQTCIEKLGIQSYFDEIQPLTSDGDKCVSLKRLLDKVKPDEAVMVGDRCYDFAAATANGIPFVACMYGYVPDPEELDGARWKAEEPGHLLACIQSVFGGV